MRNVTVVPFSEKEELVLATDNSGGIGLKEGDFVKVPYDVVGYYSLRVAIMECLAAGATPISVVIHNFSGDESWGALVKGVKQGLEEVSMLKIPITGSSESNFSLMQSAVGMIVVGKREVKKRVRPIFDQVNLAVIGMPLVGNEVVTMGERVAPLSLFKELSSMEGVTVWPVGSKGILLEVKQMFPEVEICEIVAELDVAKSAGPSTCFIIAYDHSVEDEVKKCAGYFYHEIHPA
ncbi:ATP-binding protein [Cytobacillus sp. FJAT-54145]|uniref:ATP-binding protein n=1 Tax=Cytobacillus spartinae TaxID=3299023 RepID=A0ABW6KFP8_9BACI